MPDTFTPWVVCRPLIKASVNICVVVSDFTRNWSGLLLRFLRPMYHYCYCKSCLIDPMWYLCSNCWVKQINNSLKNGTGTTEFCIFLEVVKSIGIDSVATNRSWSFISSQKYGCKILNNYCFTQFHAVTGHYSIGNRDNTSQSKFCLVQARKHHGRNSGYPYSR